MTAHRHHWLVRIALVSDTYGAISASYPLAAPALLSLAALVAYSRVALRVHHTGDVIAGAALGAAGVAAASALL